MNVTRRGWLIAALAVAVVVFVGSVAAVAAGVGWATASGSDRGMAAEGYGPGSTGFGPGMMGGGSGNGQPVTTMAEAKARAQAFADQLGSGLKAGEVMQFSNGYYSELLTADGTGATEVLIDPASGAVSIEYGPAMMWNTRYGMHAVGNATARVSADQAVKDAQAWLDAQHSGLTAGEATAFPGYYTLHTLKDGKIVGMMSINAVTGAAWYHTWHGTFTAMVGE